ncbi:hypothetical protein D9M71_329740 [compost metagenome]
MQLKGRAGCDIGPGVHALWTIRCSELRWGAAVRPRQPAPIDQDPQAAGLIQKGLQQLDPRPAIAGTVIQQDAVLGIEAAEQVHAAKRRVVVLLQLCAADRFGGATLGVAGEQYAFLIGPAQLPGAEKHQQRQ